MCKCNEVLSDAAVCRQRSHYVGGPSNSFFVEIQQDSLLHVDYSPCRFDVLRSEEQ